MTTQYKCAHPGCRYVSDEAGDCCNQELVSITAEEGSEVKEYKHSEKHEHSEKKEHDKCNCC